MAQQHFFDGQGNSVGAKIREIRKNLNLTQTELSHRVGIQQSDLSRMEKGEYRVGLDTLIKILSIFEMDMGSFFGDGAEGAATEDRESWRLFRALGDDERREVRDFIRFKAVQSQLPQPPESD